MDLGSILLDGTVDYQDMVYSGNAPSSTFANPFQLANPTKVPFWAKGTVSVPASSASTVVYRAKYSNIDARELRDIKRWDNRRLKMSGGAVFLALKNGVYDEATENISIGIVIWISFIGRDGREKFVPVWYYNFDTAGAAFMDSCYHVYDFEALPIWGERGQSITEFGLLRDAESFTNGSQLLTSLIAGLDFTLDNTDQIGVYVCFRYGSITGGNVALQLLMQQHFVNVFPLESGILMADAIDDVSLDVIQDLTTYKRK